MPEAGLGVKIPKMIAFDLLDNKSHACCSFGDNATHLSFDIWDLKGDVND